MADGRHLEKSKMAVSRKRFDRSARNKKLGGWLQVTCGLTACTPGSTPDPTLGNEYGKPLPFYCILAPSAAGIPNEGFSTTTSAVSMRL